MPNFHSTKILGDLQVTGDFTGVKLNISDQLISTVATGTAPFVISSTTVVSNLNVTYLQGSTPGAFAAVSHTHPYSLVNLNGSNFSNSTATLFAPTTSATTGWFLRSVAGNNAPLWGALTANEVTTALGYTAANTTALSSYLPLTGGTLTNDLTVNTNILMPVKGTAGTDKVHISLQGVAVNDASNENGGAFIEFRTSTSGGYGGYIGAHRRPGGLSALIFKNGAQTPSESMRIDENQNLISAGEITSRKTSGTAILRAHAKTDTSPVAVIELMRGANDTFGADAYNDWRLRNDGGTFYIDFGASGTITNRLTLTSAGVLSLGTQPVVLDNDSRLTDSRTPTTHTQANLNGTNVNLPTFYAPTTSATTGWFLRSVAGNNAPLWGALTANEVTTALGYTPYSNTNPSGYITGINSSMVTTALGYTPYSSTNPSGYITGINSSMVTTALGFTPYSSTNPSGYITGINSSMVTTALGFTPYSSTNPSGYTNNTITFNGSGTANPTFFAPTTSATTGYILKANTGNSAPTWALLTSAEITTALTYTPYSSTNPSGYTTSSGVTSVTGTGAISSSGGNTPQISHSTAAGYVHIPSGGASAQILQYASAGTAQWYTPPWTANVITMNDATNLSPTFFAPTVAGTINQYLRSNGSGTPSWETLPSTYTPSSHNQAVLNGVASTYPSFYAPTTGGTAGQFLISSGANAPVWSTPSFAPLFATVTSTTATSLTLSSTYNNTVLLLSSTSTVNLTTGTTSVGTQITVVKTGASGTINFVSGSGQNLNGSTTTLTLTTQWKAVTLIASSTSSWVGIGF